MNDGPMSYETSSSQEDGRPPDGGENPHGESDGEGKRGRGRRRRLGDDGDEKVSRTGSAPIEAGFSPPSLQWIGCGRRGAKGFVKEGVTIGGNPSPVSHSVGPE